MNAYGLMLGLDNKFSLGAGIFLAGDFSTGLAYSIYSMDSLQLPSQRVNGFFGLNTDSSSHEMIPIIDARMDVGWERSFYDNQIGVRLNIGYEYHVLINGFSAIANPDIGNGIGFLYQKTNLFLQGLTLGAKMSY